MARYTLLLVMLAVIWFPVYYMFIGSIMNPHDLAVYPSKLAPSSGLDFANYAQALSQTPMLTEYWNSILVALIITAAQIITSMSAAYAFVFLPLRHPNLWFGIFLATMAVPAEATIIPNYLFMADSGLMNTIAALVLPFLATGFGTFLARQAFKSFPRELRDAARMDGCKDIRFLWQILLPLSRPTLATIGINAFMSAWGMYLWPLLVSQTPNMQTIQIGLSQLKSDEAYTPGFQLAGAVIAVLPALLLVIFGQKFIVKGLTAGSVKS